MEAVRSGPVNARRATACAAIALGTFALTQGLQAPAGTFVGSMSVNFRGSLFPACTLLQSQSSLPATA